MRLLLAAVTAATTLAAPAQSQSTTVVELYTSQGCSSCPPADAMLHELAEQKGVIALALHVDYWDYIGWKDEFARPAHTVRQKAYARVAGSRTIYTPQMVIGGVDHVIGTRPEQVAAALAEHMMKTAPVEIEATRSGNSATITLRPLEPLSGEMVVQLVTYNPSATVSVRRGENAGRELEYTNIVTSWTAVDAWNGGAPVELTAEIPNDDPAVIIVQFEGPGPILAEFEIV